MKRVCCCQKVCYPDSAAAAESIFLHLALVYKCKVTKYLRDLQGNRRKNEKKTHFSQHFLNTEVRRLNNNKNLHKFHENACNRFLTDVCGFLSIREVWTRGAQTLHGSLPDYDGSAPKGRTVVVHSMSACWRAFTWRIPLFNFSTFHFKAL